MSETTPGVRTAPPPTTTRTGLVLLLVCTAAALIPAGITGPSVALPDIGRDLGASLVELQWVVNAYNLTFASAMLAGGTTADLLGRRRVFVG
ncbi:MAG: MFS transporter, partial [Pseudonocardia sp.]|nr:MFS transporter [Pseudonocardia sp.]